MNGDSLRSYGYGECNFTECFFALSFTSDSLADSELSSYRVVIEVLGVTYSLAIFTPSSRFSVGCKQLLYLFELQR